MVDTQGLYKGQSWKVVTESPFGKRPGVAMAPTVFISWTLSYMCEP